MKTLIEAMDFFPWLLGVVLLFVGKIIYRMVVRHRNTKKYSDNSLGFKPVKGSGIEPIAHGEPFWRIADNNVNDDNNRFLIYYDSNDQDKSKDNEVFVDRLISERIGNSDIS